MPKPSGSHATFLRRLLLALILAPLVYLLATGASFFVRSRSAAAAVRSFSFERLDPPTASERLLVIAPHPDDEALGCAGSIQQVLRAGGAARVVYLTNGDGFRLAAQRQLRLVRADHEACAKFGRLRMEEGRVAAKVLGLSSGDLAFLGYPDKGLQSLWRGNWSRTVPFRSPWTLAERSPYDSGDSRVYCGESLLADLERELASFRPTAILATHPLDDHPDHSAASAFTTLALERAREGGAAWARECELRYYLIHRGNWPVPQGDFSGAPLLPPANLIGPEDEWRTVPLGESELKRKRNALESYGSQLTMMRRFLSSFVRSNELVAVPKAERFGSQTHVSPDPVSDSMLRELERGADIRSVIVNRSAGQFRIGVETHGAVAKGMTFRVSLRHFGTKDRPSAGGYVEFVVDPVSRSSTMGALVETDTTGWVVALSERDLAYSRRLALTVESQMAGVPIDRTATRFVQF